MHISLPVGLSDVLDMWLGESERRLHGLFEQARRAAPCVLFIDEIDALGQKRSQMRHSAGRNVVNQLLAELDGAHTDNESVLCPGGYQPPVGCRHGASAPRRLDRTLLVLPPDEPARVAILTTALGERPVDGADVGKLARRTDGFSGADLVHLVEVPPRPRSRSPLRTGTAAPDHADTAGEGPHRSAAIDACLVLGGSQLRGVCQRGGAVRRSPHLCSRPPAPVREPAASDNPATGARERGAALIDAGRPTEALIHLRRAVADDPGDAGAQCLIALAHLKLNEPERALEAAAAGAALDPENGWPQRLMASSLGELGKKRKAKAAALEACRLEPQEPMAHIVLSRALQTTGDEAGALAAARHAVELHPGSPEAQHQVGCVLLAHERLPEAEAAFRAVLALDAEHSNALNNLAVVHLRMDRSAEALDELELAARLDPRSKTVRGNLIWIGHVARIRRRVAVLFALLGAGMAAGGHSRAALFSLGIAGAIELRRRSTIKDLDAPARTLIDDDARARRFHPSRWEWKRLQQPWLLVREGAKKLPASLVLGINVGVVAIYAVNGGLAGVIITALVLPFTARRFYRLWRRKHPRQGSWRPEDPG